MGFFSPKERGERELSDPEYATALARMRFEVEHAEFMLKIMSPGRSPCHDASPQDREDYARAVVLAKREFEIAYNRSKDAIEASYEKFLELDRLKFLFGNGRYRIPRRGREPYRFLREFMEQTNVTLALDFICRARSRMVVADAGGGDSDGLPHEPIQSPGAGGQ